MSETIIFLELQNHEDENRLQINGSLDLFIEYFGTHTKPPNSSCTADPPMAVKETVHLIDGYLDRVSEAERNNEHVKTYQARNMLRVIKAALQKSAGG